MKKSLYLPLLLVVLAFAVACGGGQESAAPEIPTTTSEKSVDAGQPMVYTASIGIEGMTCSQMCASTIQSKLAAMDGVTNCKVDFEGKTAYVDYENDKVNENAMVATITGIADGAYSVTTIDIAKPVPAAKAPATNGEEVEAEEEQALNVQAPVIKVPNVFDLFSRLYRL